VSSNAQNLSENSQKSTSYNDVTTSYDKNNDGPAYIDDIRHGSSKTTLIARDIGQNETVVVSQVPSEVSRSDPGSNDISSEVSDRDLYVEVYEQEVESRYIEVPKSDSDFDYLLVGHAVVIEPVYHWERVVRPEVHGYLMS
jgi:hypothetical protein